MKKINDIYAIKIIFFICACYVGLWSIRIPTIKDQLQTDYVGVGYIMLSFATGSIIAMILANNLILRTSTKSILIFTLIAEGCLWLPVPFIRELWIFMVFSFIFGMSYGAFEIACNVYASNVEVREKKSMMSGFHAFWSLGVLFGSLCTSLLLQWNYSFMFNILLFIFILLPLSLYFAFCLDKQVESKSDSSSKNNIFFIWPLIIFLIAIIAMANALTEGSVDAWSALYMRDFIKVDGFYIGVATLSFNIFMVIGRLYGDRVRDRIGSFLLILFLFVSSIISLLILVNLNNIYAAIIGFSLLGIGASAIVPIVFSIAGQIEGIDTGVGITIVSISVYTTFAGAPALLGIIANNYGINNIFVPMLIIFIILLFPIIIFRKKF